MFKTRLLCAAVLFIALVFQAGNLATAAHLLDDEFEGADLKQQNELPTEQDVAKMHTPSTKTVEPKRSSFGLNGDISGTGSYVFEMICGVLLLAYLIVHIVGRAANRKIIDSWLNRYDAYFSEQFAAAGAPDTAHAPADLREKVFQESANEYVYYATGRQNVSSVHFKFNLRHRQDVMMYLWDTVLYPVEDKVTIEMVFANDRKCDPALFAILPKAFVVPFREEHANLREIMVATQHASLGGGVVLLAENAEAATELIPEGVLAAILTHEEYFESLFVTDLNNTAPQGYTDIQQHICFCTLRIPSDPASIAPLFEMLMTLADHLATVKLSMIAKGKVDKNRRTIKDQLEKIESEKAKEALEQKKQEKAEKEKLLYDTLTPQEKARRDEKEEKKRKKDEEKKRFKKKSV